MNPAADPVLHDPALHVPGVHLPVDLGAGAPAGAAGSRGARVALAAPHPLAVEAGRRAVAAGGGAVDAALAAAAALTVAYPHQCAVGGDLVALLRHPDGRVEAVLSVGAAPLGVDVAALRAAGDRMPAEGPLTVTVPGVVAGWHELARRSVLGLAPALEDAARLAEAGVPVSPGLVRGLAWRRDVVLADPGLRGVLTRDGEPLGLGDVLHQPALAQTLRTLAADPAAMSTGPVARALASWLGERGSAMTAADLAAHRPEVVAPLRLEHGGSTWWAAPPPTQGATLLALLAGSPDGGARDGAAAADPGGTGGRWLPTIAAVRAASTARDQHLGDPRRGPVDVEALLDPADGAHPVPSPPRPNGDTVAVVAADADGLVVTLIQSVYQTFGAGMLHPETGVLVHNRGTSFSLAPGHPGEIGPGLRPPHTLCPLVVERGGVVLGVGCQGGRAQPQVLAQTAPSLLTTTGALADVLAAPRRVVGSLDLGYAEETVLLEPGAVEPEAGGAVELPVDRVPGPVDDTGHVQVVRLGAAGLEVASDPRADGLGVLL